MRIIAALWLTERACYNWISDGADRTDPPLLHPLPNDTVARVILEAAQHESRPGHAHEQGIKEWHHDVAQGCAAVVLAKLRNTQCPPGGVWYID